MNMAIMSCSRFAALGRPKYAGSNRMEIPRFPICLRGCLAQSQIAIHPCFQIRRSLLQIFPLRYTRKMIRSPTCNCSVIQMSAPCRFSVTVCPE